MSANTRIFLIARPHIDDEITECFSKVVSILLSFSRMRLRAIWAELGYRLLCNGPCVAGGYYESDSGEDLGNVSKSNELKRVPNKSMGYYPLRVISNCLLYSRTLTQPMARLPLPEKKKARRGPERRVLGLPARQPYHE